MKLGIIGSGVIVQEFLPMLTQMEEVEIVGILGTPRSYEKVQNLCNDYGFNHAWTSFKEMCESEVDTVYVAVPNSVHFTYCEQALKQGLHVIVEKPITSNLKEFSCLEKLAKEKDCFIFEAVTTPYFESFQKIKEWLPLIGEVKIVQCQFSKCSSRYKDFQEGKILPVFDVQRSGGTLMDLNIYNLHFVIGLFGEPVSAQHYANIEREVDTSGVVAMQYEGFQAVCLAAKDCDGIRGALIQGTNGCIRVESSVNRLGTVKLQLSDGREEEYNDGMEDIRMIPEFLAFCKAIQEKDQDIYQSMLVQSKAVTKLQTELRKQAGIVFLAD